MAIMRKLNKGVKGTLLTIGVITSTFTEINAQGFNVSSISEETRSKYVVYQDIVESDALEEEDFKVMAQIIGSMPFTLPSGIVDMRDALRLGDEFGLDYKFVDQGVAKLELTYKTATATVLVEGTQVDATIETKKFTDVDENHKYYDAIESCVNKSIMVGESDTRFNATGVVDVATVLTGLNRVMVNNQDLKIRTSRYIIDDLFRGLDSSHWAYNSILNMASKIKPESVLEYASYGNDIYTREISRVEIARAIYDLFSGESITYTNANMNFTDISSDFTAIDFVSSTGIMIGCGNDTFSPDSYLTRGELATILNRVDNLYGKRAIKKA